MRLFVCEYVTGGGLCGEALAPALCREGDAMLQALVKDLLDLPGIEVVATRDARLPRPELAVEWEILDGPGQAWRRWRRLVETADALWPIAPETGGALEWLSRLAIDAGRRLIGSEPASLRLTASKAATTAHLQAQGIPAVATGTATAPPESSEGWVVKPDDGAGCEDTWLLPTRRALDRWIAESSGRHGRGYVLQPFVPGPACSLSLLCCGGRARLLSSNRQDVVIDNGRFRHLGSTPGGPTATRAIHEDLSRRIAAAVPGLWGYVGVDFIESTDGPVVLEVNPRLTTSYVGLRQALGANPAALVLDLPAAEGSIPASGKPALVRC